MQKCLRCNYCETNWGKWFSLHTDWIEKPRACCCLLLTNIRIQLCSSFLWTAKSTKRIWPSCVAIPRTMGVLIILFERKIGRASCREREWVEMQAVGGRE